MIGGRAANNVLSQTWLMFVPAFYSFFYGGTNGTYLSLHFSVRARALSSLVSREHNILLREIRCY